MQWESIVDNIDQDVYTINIVGRYGLRRSSRDEFLSACHKCRDRLHRQVTRLLSDSCRAVAKKFIINAKLLLI